MIEEICCGDFGFTFLGIAGVDGGEFGIDERGLPCHGFEHGVGAESVKIGARVGERELRGDAGEGEGWVECESVESC